MNRKEFLRNSVLLGSTLAFSEQSAFAGNLVNNPIDRLADEQGNFVHQALPFAENALEPHMDAETVHLHYTFHHGNAVKAANKFQGKIREAMDKGEFENVDFYTKKLILQSSSHILHSIFWTNLSIQPTQPKGELLRRIEQQYGSYDKMQQLLAYLSKNVDGNGWGILGYQPYFDRLTVLQCENHEKLTQWGVVPLLVIDVWEHAYYLKWRNKRDGFVDSLFALINWDNVAERLEQAVKLK
ncbi:MAG TPA: superoxide dismutase [Saprospiraceae bacterium]|nr:superoxide dismutase [Saprospiraceae bacterium]HOY07173.1 superoxide dismutase [Saprospiraceae bacterium]HPI07856.1 superoxide dismutase [Saprospiraceae bacterium]